MPMDDTPRDGAIGTNGVAAADRLRFGEPRRRALVVVSTPAVVPVRLYRPLPLTAVPRCSQRVWVVDLSVGAECARASAALAGA